MKLALLDRDGVLNEDRPDFVKHPGELVMLPGSAAAVARLNVAGIRVAVCTNQSCIGRGIVGADMMERIHQTLRDRLAEAGARVDAIFVAPDPPWAATERRKPGPGMLREAMAQFRIAPHDAVMVGDTTGDMQAALAAGVRRILVRTGKGAATQAQGLPAGILPVAVHDDLAAAVAALLP